jgi:hypothetical protein
MKIFRFGSMARVRIYSMDILAFHLLSFLALEFRIIIGFLSPSLSQVVLSGTKAFLLFATEIWMPLLICHHVSNPKYNAPLSEILYSGHVDIFQNKSFAFLALWTYLVVAYDIFSVKFDQCFGISSLKLVDVWTD